MCTVWPFLLPGLHFCFTLYSLFPNLFSNISGCSQRSIVQSAHNIILHCYVVVICWYFFRKVLLHMPMSERPLVELESMVNNTFLGPTLIFLHRQQVPPHLHCVYTLLDITDNIPFHWQYVNYNCKFCFCFCLHNYIIYCKLLQQEVRLVMRQDIIKEEEGCLCLHIWEALSFPDCVD